MKTTFRSLFVCTAIFAPLVPPGALAADDAAAGARATSLWKVQKREAGGSTVYLAGSIHLLREEDHPLPPAFEQAFAASDELVLEVVSAEMAAAQDVTMERGMYGGEGKISDDISPEALRELRGYLEGGGLSRDAMDGFRPWMASMMISLTEMMKLGCVTELGVDSYFENKAIREGKPVRGLETSEFQIGLFATLEKKDQEAMLVATLEDAAEMEVEFPRMAEAWREGKDEELDKIMHDSLSSLPELRKAILDDRNMAWVGEIERMLDGGRDVMVVVGAGHLVGDVGVVALLERRGHRVERFGAGADEALPAAGDKGAREKKPRRFIEL